ncbi:MAG: VWA domain-containing protein, partial [Opitutaceae bacterium]
MAKKRRELEVFSLSFLDCICCGFGAVLLIFLLTIAKKTDVDKADVDAARDRLRRVESQMTLNQQ